MRSIAAMMPCYAQALPMSGVVISRRYSVLACVVCQPAAGKPDSHMTFGSASLIFKIIFWLIWPLSLKDKLTGKFTGYGVVSQAASNKFCSILAPWIAVLKFEQ